MPLYLGVVEATTPTLAQVLAAGSDPGGTAIEGADGGTGVGGGQVAIRSGSGNAEANDGASLTLAGGDDGGTGGGVGFSAGSGSGSGGGSFSVGGGEASNGGNVTFEAGNGDTSIPGGSVTLTAGFGNDGGDSPASITIGGGTGSGDAGEVIIVGSTVTFGEGGAGTSIQTTANDVTIANAPLRLDDGSVAVTLRSGSADPSAGGGVAANVGSLFLRDDGAGTGELWVKTGAADTAWTKVI